eukprot:TRINITY_DN1113_c3_g1_i2.p1 TRINITY_DN1113_c3_g1~~TRINITY_DN1113_c3_g1_i2.p1  ORF type:complete len:538 (+),score=247.51 TRINITY_DN1113_c3_g1_i2:128-1741(+)
MASNYFSGNYPELGNRNNILISKIVYNQLPIINSENLLESFVSPFSKEEFLSNIWKKKCLAVITSSERFENLIENHFYSLDLNQLLENSASENIFVWMRNTTSEGGGKIDSFETDNSSTAEICYNSGASLYFRASQDTTDEFVRAMSMDLGINFAGIYAQENTNKGEIEIFVSRTGHYTDWHFDFMENFTFQLKGKKKWIFKQGQVKNPIRGFTPHYNKVDNLEQQLKAHRLSNPNFQSDVNAITNSEFEEITLTEGSVLYFPAGTWHSVECIEDSISINISLIGTTWGDLVTESIRHMLFKQEHWRDIISSSDVNQARQHLTLLLSRLQLDLQGLSAENILPYAVNYPRVEHIDLNLTQPAEEENNDEELEGEDEGEGKGEGEDENENEGENEDEDEGEGEGEGEDKGEFVEQNEDMEINFSSTFRVNPLSVLISQNELDKLNNSSELEQDSNLQHTFIVHVNFGNEELTSTIRTRIIVKNECFKIANWLISRRDPFQVRDILSMYEGTERSSQVPESVKKLLRILSFNGFLSFQN